MNAMGHDVPNMIGVDHSKVVKDITNVLPDYMVMGERGMADMVDMVDMADMEMPLPDNTARMMSGEGPFGSVEMGGMFSMVKVRKDQKHGDYKDPGWYQHPASEVAYEWTGALPNPARFASEGGQTMKALNMPMKEVKVQVRKPPMGRGHMKH